MYPRRPLRRLIVSNRVNRRVFDVLRAMPTTDRSRLELRSKCYLAQAMQAGWVRWVDGWFALTGRGAKVLASHLKREASAPP